MDFFSAEEKAKKRTSRLILLFVLAVIGTIIGTYLATIVAMRWVTASQHHGYGPADDVFSIQLWQPMILGEVALATLAVVGCASLYKWSLLSGGGAAVAESVEATRIQPDSKDPAEHRLLNVVEEMAIASGVPVPAVYLLPNEPAINAFAAGLTTSDAVVVVTRGALDKLTRDELQGVIGHEFSHILNGDMRVNIRLTAIVFGILVIGLAGRAILWSLGNVRTSSREGKGSGGVIAATIAAGVVLMIIGYIGYFFGRMILAAVSRQREFLADASSVQFTRNPGAITGALKKIGGYSLGSSLVWTHREAEIGHFFFAQGFNESFFGLWATHPPLSDRIRAIEPQFDGKFPDETVIDIATQGWSSVTDKVRLAPAAAPAAPIRGAGLIALAGTLTAEGAAQAGALIESMPASLRDAARSAKDAQALLYGLVLAADPQLRQKQFALIEGQAGPDFVQAVRRLEPSFSQLKPEQGLPLAQLSLPALKELAPADKDRFASTLEAAARIGGQSTFVFALQKMVLGTLERHQDPSGRYAQIYSFNAVAPEISVVLSAFAHASSDNDDEARKAFQIGAGQLKLLDGKLSFVPAGESDMDHLDVAIDKLAVASGPIKGRLLVAAAHVVTADGVLLPREVELLRAVAAALEVPVPPLTE